MSTFSQFSGGGGIKSIQRGTVFIPHTASSTTVTVTAVNTAKSQLRYLGGSTYQSGDSHVTLIPSIILTNSTTITVATRGDLVSSQTGQGCAISWELTEWN